MSSSGQANEAGSVARRNVGTYFGVYMLTAQPIEALENFKAIIHIAFESSDPTDDLVLTFEGGSRAFASVKRKVTFGEAFTDTVGGWVAQLDRDLGHDDLLLLVCEEAAEWVRDLAEALTRLRSGVAADSKRHRAALERLEDLVPPDKHSEVLRRARILTLPRTATEDDRRTLLTLMMDALVEHNAGSAAVSAISESVHGWAGRGIGFDAERLVNAISARGIAVRADETGPAAARAAAARAAVAKYLDVLAAPRGRVDPSLLADDLAPITVDDLLAHVRVTEPSEDRSSGTELRIMLRRNRRILLVGQPGSGKSLAMRELAAWCASDSDAPHPIPIHLPDLLPRHPDHDLAIEDFLTLAAERGSKTTAMHVEKFLNRSLEDGDAILLLDGLDECRNRTAWMASQLRSLISGLPSAVAVVVATRASAEVPAVTIGLPRVDLVRPGDLDATIDAVLAQCAMVRVPDPDQRQLWLKTRRDWLAEARDRQSGMLQVPQLALLVTLIISSTGDLEIPRQRAELLHEAVKQSVQRWEHDRFTGVLKGTWASELTPDMLLDGFAVLGRLLDGESAPSRPDSLVAVSHMLTASDGWNLAPAKARELAEQVLTFWDSHVAVFTVDPEGRLQSRSRVFTEIATAMWTRTCPEEELRAWAYEAVRYFDSEGVVALALGINAALVNLLLEVGEHLADATLAVTQAVESGSVSVGGDDMDSLVKQLARHINAIECENGQPLQRLSRGNDPLARFLSGSQADGPSSWPLIRAMCSLSLSEEQRPARDAALHRVRFGSPHDTTLKAWTALSDAKHDARDLTAEESETVAAVLWRELPKAGKFEKVDGVYTLTDYAPLDPGLGPVAELATGFIGDLPSGSAEKVFRIADHVSIRERRKIKNALRRAGVNTASWESTPQYFTNIKNLLGDGRAEAEFLQDLARLDDPLPSIGKTDRWSLGAVADLVQSTGYAHTAYGDFRVAFERDDVSLRRRWLRAIGVAHCIPLDRVAAQAAFVGAQDPLVFGLPPDWRVVSCQSFARAPLDTSRLSHRDQEALLDGMQAKSHWIAFVSLYVLANASPTWDTVAFYETDRSGWPPYRASECYLLSLLVSSEGRNLAARAIVSTEPARRHALSRALEYRPDLDDTGKFAARLALDDDLWVQGKWSGEGSMASYWTCRWCGERNEIGERTCANCELSSRPRSDDEGSA